MHHSLCLATNAATADKVPSISASSPRKSDDGDERFAVLQILLSPPFRAVASSFVCDCTQAVVCNYPKMMLAMPKERERHPRASSLSECLGAEGGLR